MLKEWASERVIFMLMKLAMTECVLPHFSERRREIFLVVDFASLPARPSTK